MTTRMAQAARAGLWLLVGGPVVMALVLLVSAWIYARGVR